MTVFDDDTRLSTTIIRNGECAIGTKLESPEIAAMVLKNGGIYNADASILGKAYKTVYCPIQDSHRAMFDPEHSVASIFTYD